MPANIDRPTSTPYMDMFGQAYGVLVKRMPSLRTERAFQKRWGTLVDWASEMDSLHAADLIPASELVKIAQELMADDALPALPDFKPMSIREIGSYIRGTWKNPFYGAKPYISAMQEIDNNGMYIQDSWESIVAYFLSNAQTWRGPEAKAVKFELNRRLKTRRMNG